MRTNMLLKQQIKLCAQELEQHRFELELRKQKIKVGLLELTRHLPSPFYLALIAGAVTLVSPRARGMVWRVNKKLLLGLLDVRLGLKIITLLTN